MDLNSIANSCKEQDGIWIPRTHVTEISYPEEGNSWYADIEDKSYWFIHRNNIISFLAQKFCVNKELVDIGAGNGFVSSKLIESEFEVYLIEPGLQGILNAKDRGLKNLINASFEEINLPENSIINAGLFDVIEHIKDNRKFLRMIFLTLKTDGIIILTVPAFRFLWSNADEEARHFNRYNLKEISGILKESGFTIIFKSYLFSFLFPLVFLFKTIPFKFNKRKASTISSTGKDHTPTIKIISSLINHLCRYEEKMIRKGRKIVLGSSCIIVAKK